MTLPVYLADPAALADVAVGGTVEVTGPEARHAVTVRRTMPGERVQVADGQGLVVLGPVLSAARDELVVAVEEVRRVPEREPRFVLVQALAKNDRDDQAIEAATELGVDEVIPWQAERSIVQWRGERGEKARRKWDQVLVAATKQSRRARRPVLGETVSTAQLAARLRRSGGTEADGTAYLLLEHASEPLAGRPLPATGEVIVVVGPEGGIAPSEVEMLTAAGAIPVRLGETVLRSSSAGPAALAVLNAAGRWS